MNARIRRLELPEGRRILAISDIHGNLPYLRGLLEKLRFSPDDILFIVGDFLEKGRESLATLRYIMELSRTHRVHVSSGNCDWWIPILYSQGPLKNNLWYVNNKPHNLARQMCAEIGYPVSMDMDLIHMRDTLADRFPDEIQFLRQMPEIFDTEYYTFVHGGLPEGSPESWDAWQCMKFDNFMNRSPGFDKWVVCGHWPVMLYHENIVNANPVFNYEKKIISIDGGCVLKDDGQLNALIIPENGSEDFSFEAYAPFPTARVLDAQAGSEKSWYIRWGDARVRVLERGPEFSRCRHIRTGYEMDILTSYLYGDGEDCDVNDCTDYVLPLAPGDLVSVVETTSRGYFVKHRGISGWYSGRLEML